MHSIVMDKEWQSMTEAIRQLTVTELRKLKIQYKHFKEVKSRHITDM